MILPIRLGHGIARSRHRVDGESQSGYVGHMSANTANISFAKNHLSELIDRVRAGHTITILDRRRPVARLSPIAPEEDKDWIRDLVRRGIISEPRKRPDRRTLDRLQPVRLKGNADIVAAVIADREDRV